MQKIPVFLFSFWFCVAFGQKMEQGIDPPGTIQVNSELYIDKTPVTNLMFMEYLKVKHFLAGKGFQTFKEYQESTEDTIKSLNYLYLSPLVNLETAHGEIYKKAYIEDYKYHPVLGITKEEAEDYCSWRSGMVSYLWQTNPKHIAKRDYASRINYRLPFNEELAAAKNYFQDKEQLLLVKGKNPVRFKTTKNPKDFTLFKISEYTQTDTLYGENYKGIVPESFPNDVTGFRCVCEILS
ncbi:formylglycine-generating enzyme family protein [Antarcticibacterium arcticum]|uniref:Formylglycine-generating enzyme family protein n=1 Tax=Antarcticibacterium arcticum TaxID=2585771 RepID=A0A5B8YJW6_9FLAO|nr:SUMF1/EgtB/PvdO family nonheme iron enzyme [Antarcticibacterium arcticum]QED37931.1 formylglycine-generating enzyme family protein [Antarcticibacterium arcticum]